MKTNSMFCSLSKKCREEYSKEVSKNMLREEDNLEEIYKEEKSEKDEK